MKTLDLRKSWNIQIIMIPIIRSSLSKVDQNLEAKSNKNTQKLTVQVNYFVFRSNDLITFIVFSGYLQSKK